MKPGNKIGWMSKRKIGVLDTVENKYYIFCEGKKTEPLYFKGLRDQIEKNSIYKNTVFIEIEGVGADTIKVLEYAEVYVKRNDIQNAQIWCVYDKDDFPAVRFNAVAQRADYLNSAESSVKYNVAWSNQCVEYWFVLHFDYYDSDNDRRFYRHYLHEKFRCIGWTRYEKNNEELFQILMENGDPKLAIKRAKKRLQHCEGCTDADAVPATKVHMLVEGLAKYLPEDIRSKFI
ncbi:MAG TPA: RloB domain-containing protein [Clostridiales bacterium]|nr:RloB domain-containing protein [Clostridiales bacterium]